MLHASSIPKGLCPPAQGGEERATLGVLQRRRFNPEGVVACASNGVQARKASGHNPFRVGALGQPCIKGSTFLATLGFMSESLWDSSWHADANDPCKVQRAPAHSVTQMHLKPTNVDEFSRMVAEANR